MYALRGQLISNPRGRFISVCVRVGGRSISTRHGTKKQVDVKIDGTKTSGSPETKERYNDHHVQATESSKNYNLAY
jgi:hypothetical protein